MAPQLKADASTAAKMAEIKRTIWSEAHGGTPVTAELPKPTNGFANKNPKANVDISLAEFEVDGEKTDKVYIADAWPIDHEQNLDKERYRRIQQGHGPLIAQGILDNGVVTYVTRRHPTKRYWTRKQRRAHTRAQRVARKIMRRAAR